MKSSDSWIERRSGIDSKSVTALIGCCTPRSRRKPTISAKYSSCTEAMKSERSLRRPAVPAIPPTAASVPASDGPCSVTVPCSSDSSLSRKHAPCQSVHALRRPSVSSYFARSQKFHRRCNSSR